MVTSAERRGRTDPGGAATVSGPRGGGRLLDSALRATRRVDRFSGDRTGFFDRGLQVFKHLDKVPAHSPEQAALFLNGL